jgi:hypothetical protein
VVGLTEIREIAAYDWGSSLLGRAFLFGRMEAGSIKLATMTMLLVPNIRFSH